MIRPEESGCDLPTRKGCTFSLLATGKSFIGNEEAEMDPADENDIESYNQAEPRIQQCQQCQHCR